MDQHNIRHMHRVDIKRGIIRDFPTLRKFIPFDVEDAFFQVHFDAFVSPCEEVRLVFEDDRSGTNGAHAP